MVKIEQCLEAFFLSDRKGWCCLHGKKAKASGVEAKEGAIWSRGEKICEALEEPPEGFQVFGQRPVYYQVFKSSVSSRNHFRTLTKVMETYGFGWILGYKDPFIPLFGRPPDIWLPFEVETSYGVAQHLGRAFFFVKNLEDTKIFVRWKPLAEKPFLYSGLEQVTEDLIWRVEFESDTPLPEEELSAIYHRRERKLKEAAKIIAEVREKAKYLGLGEELEEAMGKFPKTSGNLPRLRKLREKVRKVLGKDEELVRHLLGRRP